MIIYCKDIVEHKVGDHTKSKNVADSLGWTIQKQEDELEVAYDNSLWEKGYAPQPSIEYQNEQIRQQREARYEKESDPLRLDYDEALARGEDTAEQLRVDWLHSKDVIREELPYVVGENDPEYSILIQG